MSRIAVITPCYNSEQFIAETIASVSSQDWSDWEYVLVDDGSRDRTRVILNQAARADPRIRTTFQKNSGTGSARNLGASLVSADTQYLLFLDHDDLIEKSALRILSRYLDAHPDVGLVGCQFNEIDSAGTMRPTRGRSRWARSKYGIPRRLHAREERTPFVAFYCATGQGPFAMYRRSVFEQTTGWTSDFYPHEDTDLFCQMALLSEVHYLPDSLYRKRVHAANALRDFERVMTAYGLFRAKWDNYHPRNATEAATLREAARFYRGSFRPLRNIKVGAKALGEFARGGEWSKLRWASTLFAHSIRDVVQTRISNLTVDR